MTAPITALKTHAPVDGLVIEAEDQARRNRLISASDVAAHLLGEALRG